MRKDLKTVRRGELIEATIRVIARRGYAGTTLAMIGKTARLSPGIVSFYFKSKEGLFFETLRHLATEYETAWKVAVNAVGPDPAARLDAIIEIDLGKDVCVRRKVAVWVAFWAEAPGRPAYSKLCTELSAEYFNQMAALCREIAMRGGHAAVDPDMVARALNALIDGYWVELAMNPAGFDRDEAKRACRLFLAGVFPGEFGSDKATAEDIRLTAT